MLWAYEAGFKGDLARNGALNGSVFYYDYRDQQVLGVVINPTNGAIGRITNAPKSEIYGGELELQWTPFHGLQITQTASYKKGSYKTFDDVDASSVVKNPVTGIWTGQTIDKSGVALDFPRISYGGTVSYTWAVGNFDVQAATDYAYRDKPPSFLGTGIHRGLLLAGQRQPDDPAQGRALERWACGVATSSTRSTTSPATTSCPRPRSALPGRPATYGVRASYAF
jgi:iron complex outermembrane receptor protein